MAHKYPAKGSFPVSQDCITANGTIIFTTIVVNMAIFESE
jgi:hypothetical protein